MTPPKPLVIRHILANSDEPGDSNDLGSDNDSEIQANSNSDGPCDFNDQDETTVKASIHYNLTNLSLLPLMMLSGLLMMIKVYWGVGVFEGV